MIRGAELCVGSKIISDESPTFFIAEIGQNHQGDIAIAKKLIDAAVESGADCVKFQKTCIDEKFTEKVLNSAYASFHSWGETYGDHKRRLEFSNEQFRELQQYSSAKNVLFTASAMDLISLEFLLNIDVPFVKIGSGEAANVQLLIKAAECGKPLIVSTGMMNFEDVTKMVEIVRGHGGKFALLHCVSAYPTPDEDVHLRVINLYKNAFPGVVVGYSGHENGTEISAAAAVMGAKIIERHITLDKNQKGSDHKSSLLPEEYRTMVETVRRTEVAMGAPVKTLQSCEIATLGKLGKCIVASRDLQPGHAMGNDDLKIKVAQDENGVDGLNFLEIIDKVLKVHKEKDDPIHVEDFQ